MRLALIDLNSAFVPIYEATKNDPVDNAHDICVEKIRRIADTADHVAVCIDSPPYDRTRLYAAYKAPRSPTADQLADRDARRVQLLRVQDTLRRDGFAVLGAPGQEADDVIAALVMQATTQPQIKSITIWSSDKDLLQLVGPGVVVQSMRLTGETKAHPDPTGVDGVVARFGVGPERVAHVLALAGDGSDNVPGVPRVGERTAAKLVERHGTVEAVLQAAAEGSDPEMKPALRAALVQHVEQARTSLQLVTLNHACAVELLDALKPRAPRTLNDRPMTAPDEEEPMSEERPTTDPVNPTPVAANETPPPVTEATFEPMPAPPQARPEPPKETAIVRVDPGSDTWAMALEPMGMKGVEWLGDQVANSRLFSKFTTREAAICAIIQGRELGIPAFAALRQQHPMDVKGMRQLAMAAQLIIGLVIKSDRCDIFKCVELTDERCVWKGHRRSDPDPEVTRVEYTIAMARRAGVVRDGGPWTQRPQDMLWKTAGVLLARRLCPDVVGGLYFPGELTEEDEAA